MRPAYKSVALPRAFVPIAERNIDHIVPDYFRPRKDKNGRTLINEKNGLRKKL